jgi:hypothetical protein
MYTIKSEKGKRESFILNYLEYKRSQPCLASGCRVTGCQVLGRRVRIIGASPRGTRWRLPGNTDAFSRAICTADHEEGADNNDEDAPGEHAFPPEATLFASPVVVQPHTSEGLKAEENAERCTNQ